MTDDLNDLEQNEPVVVLIDGDPLPRVSADRLRELSPRVELIEQMSKAALNRAHVVYTATGAFDLADAPNLKWVQTLCASIVELLDTPLARSGMPVSNVRGMFATNVAELAIGMLLMMTRRLRVCEAMKVAGHWPRTRPEHLRMWGDGCFGKTIGIVGYGGVGRQVARLAAAMGMAVFACDLQDARTPYAGPSLGGAGDPEGTFPQEWFRLDQLDRMLPRCDVLVLCVPLTPTTHHAIGANQLRLLPEHAYLVDVGRGGVLDLDALCDCLNRNELAGAALDVYEQEPLPDDSPLWQIENVVLSPHVGSGTERRHELAAQVLVENVSRFLQHQPLMNLVDFEKGY